MHEVVCVRDHGRWWVMSLLYLVDVSVNCLFQSMEDDWFVTAGSGWCLSGLSIDVSDHGKRSWCLLYATFYQLCHGGGTGLMMLSLDRLCVCVWDSRRWSGMVHNILASHEHFLSDYSRWSSQQCITSYQLWVFPLDHWKRLWVSDVQGLHILYTHVDALFIFVSDNGRRWQIPTTGCTPTRVPDT